jgi:hypothetical protein
MGFLSKFCTQHEGFFFLSKPFISRFFLHVFAFWKLAKVEHIPFFIPPPQNVGGSYNGFTLSRRSVRPSQFACPLYKSYTNWRIFFKLGSNVHLNKGMCRTHVAHVSAQGHNWRSNIKQSNIRQYVMSAL